MRLTVKEAAQRAGVSPGLVYRWCEERRLAHYRAGGRGRRGKILIDPADLDLFLAGLRVEAGAVPASLPPGITPEPFTQLDASRLFEAWRRQGVLGAPPRGGGARSSE